jgi:GTP cyclohydrolase FolE2
MELKVNYKMKKDVQNEKDDRKVQLDVVGVRDVLIPIKVRDKNKGM